MDVLLILTYIFANLKLINSYLFGVNNFVTHRVEKMSNARDFTKTF